MAGSADVDPTLTEVRVTFSKPMQDGSWSWSTWGEENFPEVSGDIHYLADKRTCVLPVKLKPGKFYATWLNSSKFKNFTDTENRPSVPYLLTFRTRGGLGNGGGEGGGGAAEATKVPAPEPIPGLTQAAVLHHDDGAQTGMESISGSGHAVQFDRPTDAHYLEAVQIFASRYGAPEPPKEDFHLYVLNERQQVLADVPFPYAMIERADMKWYTLRTPSIEVPEKFMIALAFNPQRTKGIYLAYAAANGASHSLIGLPADGFEPWKPVEWMIRPTLTAEPTKAKGIQRLADWKAPVVHDPFARCRMVSFGGDSSEHMQSYGGSGPAVEFKPADFGVPTGRPVTMKGLRFFASRYGSGYSPEETKMKVQVLDAQGAKLAEAALPYAKLGYRAAWVDLVFETPVVLKQPGEPITIAFDPEATQRKGVYFYYQQDPPASHSLVGKVSDGFKPVSDREWLVRACFESPSGAGR